MIPRIFLAAALVLQPLAVADAACYVDAYGNMVCDAPVRSAVRNVIHRRRAVRAARAATYSTRYAVPAMSYRSGGSAAYSAAYAEPVYSTTSHGGYAVQVVAPAEEAPPRASEAGVASCPCGENCQCCQDLRDEVERLKAENTRLKRTVPNQFGWQQRVVPKQFAWQAPEAKPVLVAGNFN